MKDLGISTIQKTKDDESLVIRKARLIRFMNAGQTRIWIDEQISIDPGQNYTEGGDGGEVINHTYRINFRPLASPPGVDEPSVYSGNRLNIRILKIVNHA